MTDTKSRGQIVTFYSYKGGVGRSMALANVAVVLAKDRHQDVVVIDWDLEAPGLHRFFGLKDDDLSQGVIDYFYNVKDELKKPADQFSMQALTVDDYLMRIATYSGGGSIRLMSAGAGQAGKKYGERVRGFDWTDFYARWGGSQVVERLRDNLAAIAPVTLIDSRTGFTDVGGVCTVQMPDVVAMVFAFNGQNISGVARLAEQLMGRDNEVAEQTGRRPALLFVPSRKETGEIERLREWEQTAAHALDRFCQTPVVRNHFPDTLTYLRKVSVPYIPYFAYGEELASNSPKGYEMHEPFERFVGMLIEGHTQHAPEATPAVTAKRLQAVAPWAALSVVGAVVATLLLYLRSEGMLAMQDWATGAVAGLGGALVMEGILGIAQADVPRTRSSTLRTIVLSSAMGLLLGGLATTFPTFPAWSWAVAGLFSRPIGSYIINVLEEAPAIERRRSR